MLRNQSLHFSYALSAIQFNPQTPLLTIRDHIFIALKKKRTSNCAQDEFHGVGYRQLGWRITIIELVKEVVYKRERSHSLHPPFEGAQQQKLHSLNSPSLKNIFRLTNLYNTNLESLKHIYTRQIHILTHQPNITQIRKIQDTFTHDERIGEFS